MKEKFQQIYAQLRDLYQSMTPGNRLLAGLLLAVLVVSLGYLIVGSVNTGSPRSKYVRLYNGQHFTREDQIAIENALAEKGLRDHQWVGDQLEVPRKSMANYASIISVAKAITPKGRARSDTVGALTPWENATMISEKNIQAYAKDLADEIREMPGISNAAVVPRKRSNWDRSVWARKNIFSVTVFVDAVSNKPLDLNTITAIGNSVAGAFGITDREEIRKEIRIVDRRNSRSYNGFGDDLTGGQNDYLAQLQRYKTMFNGMIIDILPAIEGLKVETSVELTKRFNEKLFEVQYDEPTIMSEHVRGLDYERLGYDRFGRAGEIAQLGTPLRMTEANIDNRAHTKERKHEREHLSIVPGEERRSEIVPFTPTQVHASILFPDEYIVTRWQEKNNRQGETPTEPTPEEFEEEKKLLIDHTKRVVANLLEPHLLNLRRGTDPKDLVIVDTYRRPLEVEEELTAWQQFTVWMSGNWQSLSLMGLVLCGLCVLWTISKPAKPDPIVIYEAPEIPMDVIEARARAAAEADAAAAAEDEDEEEARRRSLDGFDRSIRSLQEEIAELVEENPDAAASVLRQWIGNIVPADAK